MFGELRSPSHKLCISRGRPPRPPGVGCADKRVGWGGLGVIGHLGVLAHACSVSFAHLPARPDLPATCTDFPGVRSGRAGQDHTANLVYLAPAHAVGSRRQRHSRMSRGDWRLPCQGVARIALEGRLPGDPGAGLVDGGASARDVVVALAGFRRWWMHRALPEREAAICLDCLTGLLVERVRQVL